MHIFRVQIGCTISYKGSFLTLFWTLLGVKMGVIKDPNTHLNSCYKVYNIHWFSFIIVYDLFCSRINRYKNLFIVRPYNYFGQQHSIFLIGFHSKIDTLFSHSISKSASSKLTLFNSPNFPLYVAWQNDRVFSVAFLFILFCFLIRSYY